MKKYGDHRTEEFFFEITEHIGVLSETGSGWQKEANIVSWRGAAPKLDIREWTDDHERMSRGLTLTTDEAVRLVQLLQDFYREELNKKGGEE